MFSWLRLTLCISGVTGVGVPFPTFSLYKTYVKPMGLKSQKEKKNYSYQKIKWNRTSVRKAGCQTIGAVRLDGKKYASKGSWCSYKTHISRIGPYPKIVAACKAELQCAWKHEGPPARYLSLWISSPCQIIWTGLRCLGWNTTEKVEAAPR